MAEFLIIADNSRQETALSGSKNFVEKCQNNFFFFDFIITLKLLRIEIIL
jgi:hypothetical protein